MNRKFFICLISFFSLLFFSCANALNEKFDYGDVDITIGTERYVWDIKKETLTISGTGNNLSGGDYYLSSDITSMLDVQTHKRQIKKLVIDATNISLYRFDTYFYELEYLEKVELKGNIPYVVSYFVSGLDADLDISGVQSTSRWDTDWNIVDLFYQSSYKTREFDITYTQLGNSRDGITQRYIYFSVNSDFSGTSSISSYETSIWAMNLGIPVDLSLDYFYFFGTIPAGSSIHLDGTSFTDWTGVSSVHNLGSVGITYEATTFSVLTTVN